MGADQQFCLRWNNFHTNITSAFESLRDDEDFVDITLACEGRQIKAHKMVLSACSPYFRSLLRGNPCQHPIVFLKDVSFANLSSILDFMYHGEVNVSHNELATFLKTAEALRVRGLAEDDNKRDGDSCTEPSSPPPPRDPPEPCSPGRPEDSDRGSEHSQLPDVQPFKRRRSGSIADDAGGGGGGSGGGGGGSATAAAAAEVLPDNVKNEPEEYINEEEDMLAQQQQQQQQQHLSSEDIKMDGFSSSTEDAGSDYLSSAGPGTGEPSRTNTTMQQLQDSFPPFIPGITVQSSAASSFLSHSASVSSAEHGRGHPPFSLEGVTGLPAGISALPGPSLAPSGGAAQDTSAQERSSVSATAVATVAATNPLDDGLQMPSSVEYHGYGGTGSDVSMLQTSHYVGSSGGFHPPNSSVDGRMKFVCSYCFKSLSTSHGLRRHISDKHTVHMHAYPCHLCGKTYKTPNSLQNHTYVYHKRKDCHQGLAA